MHMTYHIQMYNTYAVAGNEVVMTLQISGPLHFALCNYLINLHFTALSCNLYFIPVSAVSHFILDLWLSFPLHSSALSHLMASSYHVTSVLEPFL